ncbi:MAG: hypothetical protein WBC93_15545, partial [Sulfitobacter sp.]
MSDTSMQVGRGLFDFAAPSADALTIELVSGSLANRCRYGGFCYPFYNSVAEHSVLVSKLAPPENAYEALMHDAHESIMIDMPTPMKVRVSGYKELEDQVEALVRKKFDVPWPPSDAVKLADLQALWIEVHQLFDYIHP